MPCYQFGDFVPVVAADAYVHPTATLIGDVRVAARCYVGPGAVLRGDMGPIRMEEEGNLQDNCVVHSFPDQPVILRRRAHVGHAAVLHGCEIGANTLIGMNAVVMDGAYVGEDSFVGAQSFVKAGDRIADGVLALGSPARTVRPLTSQERDWKRIGTDVYVDLAEKCLAGLIECAPLRLPPDMPGLHSQGLAPPLHLLDRQDRPAGP
jgi:phenylacetic acid degradation protein